MSDLTRDVRHAARRLARTPMFIVTTVVILALGIGANTAIFSIVNSALLRPLPFPESDRLVSLRQTAPGVNIADLSASIADYVTYRAESRTLADVVLWRSSALTVTGRAEPERVDGIYATFRLLPMLGVQPILGRAMAERDDETGRPEVVILGHGYWQRRFGGDPGVVGRRIMVDGTAREIIGVLPDGFWFMDVSHDLMLPIRFERSKRTRGSARTSARSSTISSATLASASGWSWRRSASFCSLPAPTSRTSSSSAPKGARRSSPSAPPSARPAAGWLERYWWKASCWASRQEPARSVWQWLP
jgi:hypothetical protein